MRLWSECDGLLVLAFNLKFKKDQMRVRHLTFHSRDQDELMDPVEEVHHEFKIVFYMLLTLFQKDVNHLKNVYYLIPYIFQFLSSDIMRDQLNLKIKIFFWLTFFYFGRVLIILVKLINVQLRKISGEFFSRIIYTVIHEPIFMAMSNVILFYGGKISIRMFKLI